jgi:hypothetical protein
MKNQATTRKNRNIRKEATNSRRKKKKKEEEKTTTRITATGRKQIACRPETDVEGGIRSSSW